MSYFQIAIDGPSGSGKSTLAKSVAAKLNILYLDTGAMYRALGLKALQNQVSPKDERAVEELLATLDIDVRFIDGSQRIYLDGEDVSEEIRNPSVSVAASDISAIPSARKQMVDLQRKIAGNQSVVMDGRDIGSYVLPGADYKFFLTAAPEERARRRLEELKLRGITSQSYEDVLADIKYRDQQDSTRAFAPLLKMPDAIEIDTTPNTPEDTLQQLLSHISPTCFPEAGGRR